MNGCNIKLKNSLEMMLFTENLKMFVMVFQITVAKLNSSNIGDCISLDLASEIQTQATKVGNQLPCFFNRWQV